MPDVAVVCVDGSELATRAARAGLARLRDDATIIVVTVREGEDYTLVAGTGMAGGVMSPEEYDEVNREIATESRDIVRRTVEDLGLGDARTEVLEGAPGQAVCDFAARVAADVIVMGTHGRGGFKRALLGSVSDHIVRNAPCSVLVTNSEAAD